MSDDISVTFTNLSQLSHVYGAPTVDLAGQVLQRTAQGSIFMGIAMVLISIALFFLSIYSCRKSNKAPRGSNAEAVFVLLTIFTTTISLPTIIVGFICLCDIWQWTALFDPKLALAHKIFGSMGG